jgi:hypothetical protein
MSETAILVLGSHSLFGSTWESSLPWESQPETPLACLEILGASLVERTAERLNRSGVSRIWLLADDHAAQYIPWHLRKHLARVQSPSDEEAAVDRISREEARRGIKTILLVGVGPYFEFDLADILRFHHAQGAGSTLICDGDGGLPFWIFGAGDRARTGIFGRSDGAAQTYLLNGYTNRLTDPVQLRCLITDAFEGRCGLRPRGRELSPGIWVGYGARIHRDAELIPPVYVGTKARLDASAVVAQFSNVECRSVIGYGSMVERSSVFACTHVGRGLDVFDAVVDGGKLLSLNRNVAVEINDPTILAKIEPWRLGRFSRKPSRRVAFAGEAVAAPPLPAPVPVYVGSSKERHGEWETCNRQAIT